jgi:hypothetical protein
MYGVKRPYSVGFLLHSMSRTNKSVDTERRFVLAVAREKGRRGQMQMGMGFGGVRNAVIVIQSCGQMRTPPKLYA